MERREPQPTPEPTPSEPAPPVDRAAPPPPEPVPRRTRPLREARPPVARPAPLTPSPPPVPAAPPSPRSFGIRLENTVQAAPGTGVPVPVGESLAVAPPAPPKPRLTAPGGTGDGWGGGTTPVAAVQEMPKVLGDSVAEYPAEARRLGFQGKVVLEVVVDESGRVARVRVLRPLHPLLDEAAVRAAKGLRFRPGRVDGRPVSVKIPYTYVFVLD